MHSKRYMKDREQRLLGKYCECTCLKEMKLTSWVMGFAFAVSLKWSEPGNSSVTRCKGYFYKVMSYLFKKHRRSKVTDSFNWLKPLETVSFHHFPLSQEIWNFEASPDNVLKAPWKSHGPQKCWYHEKRREEQIVYILGLNNVSQDRSGDSLVPSHDAFPKPLTSKTVSSSLEW